VRQKEVILGFILLTVAVLFFGIFNPANYFFPKCPFLSLTGFQCPGCGSQRALHQLLHGNFGEVIRLNALFIPGLIYAGVGYGLAAFSPGKWLKIQPVFYGKKAAYISLILILSYWLIRNIG
jgi:hypothetical protein